MRARLGAAATRILRLLPPELAHRTALAWLGSGLMAAPAPVDDPVLAVQLWGRRFVNPLGLAAGFDKNGEALDALLRLGFGFVEAGTVTPLAQPGNPRPRLFRSARDRALINRMGFNNHGAAALAGRLIGRRSMPNQVPGIIGVNIGRNRDNQDAEADYAAGTLQLAPLADYLVVNVSSPNTQGLRLLQDPAPLARLLSAVMAARQEAVGAAAALPTPVLVKLAPDLEAEDLAAIAEVALESGIDGLIVTNTTLSRPAGLEPRFAAESGGLSGRPLGPLALEVLNRLAGLLEGRMPLIAVGGIASGADAWARIRAGASLVQLYTALVFQGPGLVAEIKRDLAARVRAAGLASVAEAVGADHRQG